MIDLNLAEELIGFVFTIRYLRGQQLDAFSGVNGELKFVAVQVIALGDEPVGGQGIGFADLYVELKRLVSR